MMKTNGVRGVKSPDLFPEIDGFILGLTPEQLKDSSLEDARREENFRFADQLLAGALAGDEAAIELDRLAREEYLPDV
jgi:hypothetical protein